MNSSQLQKVFLFSGFIITSLLSGCGGDDESTTPAAAPPPTATQAAVQIAQPKPKKKKAKSPKQPVMPKSEIDPNSMDVNQPNFVQIPPESVENDTFLFEFTTPVTSNEVDSFTIVQSTNTAVQARSAVRTVPENFVEVPEFGYTSDGYANRIRCTLDDSEMTYVPGGVCIVGIDQEGAAFGPQFSCYVESFYIDISEVSLRQYEAYRGKLKEDKKRILPPPLNADMPEDYPALGLHWGEARAYARSCGKDLPTEVEWEKAARGTNGSLRPWGNGRAVWTQPRSINTITSVLNYPNDESSYGVFDLAGNAREWCYDFYSEDSYDQAIQSSNDVPRGWAGPKVASPRNHRVVKGNGPNWNVWHRSHQLQSERDATIGFRCVLRIEPGEEEKNEDGRVTSRP